MDTGIRGTSTSAAPPVRTARATSDHSAASRLYRVAEGARARASHAASAAPCKCTDGSRADTRGTAVAGRLVGTAIEGPRIASISSSASCSCATSRARRLVGMLRRTWPESVRLCTCEIGTGRLTTEERVVWRRRYCRGPAPVRAHSTPPAPVARGGCKSTIPPPSPCASKLWPSRIARRRL